MADWRQNRGQQPCESDTLVRVRIRMRSQADAENQAPSPAWKWRWSLTSSPGDIIEWKVAA